jgi:histidyl-tRNA synthetase
VPSVMEPIRSVKGTRDLLPEEIHVWQKVEEEARATFRAYNYMEIRTPVLEQTALFARSVGMDTDIVTKEMFTFEDRDHESLTLRPEATASVVRAYIEHRLFNDGGIHKLFYIGPMFRRERPQKGRYRQFYQMGAEVLGSDEPGTDVDVLEMLHALIVVRLRLHDSRVLLNSVGCPRCRPGYVAALRAALDGVKQSLCVDCQRRAETNPLRVLDCKVEADQPIIATLPTILDYLCAECREHFDAVKQGLDERSIEYHVTPRLVRGLDYYVRTTFEITSGSIGAQNAVAGGGRYDGLSELLGGPPVPGLGFAIGEDRLVLAYGEKKAESSGSDLIYIAWLEQSSLRPAAELARELRSESLRVELLFHPMKFKKSLALASKLAAQFTIIIGPDEAASGRFAVKNMTTGEQQPVERERIASYLRVKLEELIH